jgi:hypothetical protein
MVEDVDVDIVEVDVSVVADVQVGRDALSVRYLGGAPMEIMFCRSDVDVVILVIFHPGG